MPRFIVQCRLIKLPDPDAEPDEWSSATSTMTLHESSVPFDSDYEDPNLYESHNFLNAVTLAIGRLSLPPDAVQE